MRVWGKRCANLPFVALAAVPPYLRPRRSYLERRTGARRAEGHFRGVARARCNALGSFKGFWAEVCRSPLFVQSFSALDDELLGVWPSQNIPQVRSLGSLRGLGVVLG